MPPRSWWDSPPTSWGLAGLGAVFLILLTWLTLDRRFHGSEGVQGLSLTGGPFAVAGVVALLVNLFVIPREHRFEERFQRARRGESATLPLAANQPLPDIAQLTLPIKIELRPSRSNLLLVGVSSSLVVGFGLAILVVVTCLFAVANGAFYFTDALGLAAVLGSVAAILALVITFTFGPRTLSLDDAGVSVSQRHSPNQSVLWDDVRLFAIAADSGGKRNPKTVVYTLAGPNAFVMWPYVRRLAWDTYDRPVTPFLEYERQMESLLSLIAARMGLALYDLR
jgi:hypothetical protein